MTFPICTTTRSSACICETGTKTCCSSCLTQTFFTFKDILLAKSSTDFLCVHSSNNSPMPKSHIIDAAVSKLPLAIETPIAVASKTGTSIFLFHKVLTPIQIYFTERIIAIPVRIGTGRNIFPMHLVTTFSTSFS